MSLQTRSNDPLLMSLVGEFNRILDRQQEIIESVMVRIRENSQNDNLDQPAPATIDQPPRQAKRKIAPKISAKRQASNGRFKNFMARRKAAICLSTEKISVSIATELKVAVNQPESGIDHGVVVDGQYIPFWERDPAAIMHRKVSARGLAHDDPHQMKLVEDARAKIARAKNRALIVDAVRRRKGEMH